MGLDNSVVWNQIVKVNGRRLISHEKVSLRTSYGLLLMYIYSNNIGACYVNSFSLSS
jgi:hypothetical protein